MTRAPDAPPALGFAGLGWIGRNRMLAIAQSGAARIAALCEPDPEALAEARRIAPEATVVPSFEALLDCALDGVVIATPSALHAAQATAALERGLAVFCQKPLGRHAREVREVVSTARARDRLLGVDLSYRCTDAARALRRAVREGSLGPVFAVRLTFHNAYGPDKPWFNDPRQSGGGALLDLGTHLIDLLLWVLDFPIVTAVSSQLFARGRPLRDATAVEDFAAVQLVLAGGTTVQLACSWRLHEGCDCALEASFYGAEGGVRLRNRDGSFYDFETDGLRGTTRRALSAPPDAWSGRAAVQWADQLARDLRYDPRADELIALAELIDRVYAAADCARQPETSCAS